MHCYAGVSRSVTVVVAYIMKYWKWGMKNALAFVQAKRIVAKPNDGFMEQLARYQDILFGANQPTPTVMQNTRVAQSQPRQNSMTMTHTYQSS